MRNLIALMVCAAAMTIAACNTVEGVGEDVEAAGSAVQGAAQDVQN